MTLSGASNATVMADSSGNYSFPGLANGVYTVTPTQIGFTLRQRSSPLPLMERMSRPLILPDSLPRPLPGAFQGPLVLLRRCWRNGGAQRRVGGYSHGGFFWKLLLLWSGKWHLHRNSKPKRVSVYTIGPVGDHRWRQRDGG